MEAYMTVDTTQHQGRQPTGPIASRSSGSARTIFTADQEVLQRVSWLIELATWILNGLIGLRFLLKLMAANPLNAFAQLVYFLTTPFLAAFVGLTQTPSFEGFEIEFYDLIAIIVYFVLAWAIIRLLWILFARLRPS
jgi:hypothetical protein